MNNLKAKVSVVFYYNSFYYRRSGSVGMERGIGPWCILARIYVNVVIFGHKSSGKQGHCEERCCKSSLSTIGICSMLLFTLGLRSFNENKTVLIVFKNNVLLLPYYYTVHFYYSIDLCNVFTAKNVSWQASWNVYGFFSFSFKV